MADEGGSFEVNGRRYGIVQDLTLGDMADAERYFGADFSDVNAGSSMRMAAALIWLSIRREDPTVTVEDIRELPSDIFSSFIAKGDAVPPAVGPGDSSDSSGSPSSNGGDHPDEIQPPTGSLGSGIGADSAHLTSLT